MRLSVCSCAMLCLAVLNSSITSANFITPEFRGSGHSTYQEWDSFTSAFNGPNLPDVASDNSNGTAQLFQTVPGAFVTSGGNIYAPETQTSFHVTVPDFGLGPDFLTTAIMQIRTLGTLPDLDSASLNGIAAHSAKLVFEQPLGGFGGFLRDWRFQWNNVSGNVSLNTFSFSSVASSMSLDRLVIDTTTKPVPEPGSLAFLAIATVSVAVRIRRRNNS